MANIDDKLNTIEINGKDYYTVQQFAFITGKSEVTIRHKTKYETGEKQLKHIVVANKVFILASELQNYKWTFPGKGELEYSYDTQGNKIFHEDIYIGKNLL